MILKQILSFVDDRISVYFGLQDSFSAWLPNCCFVMAIMKIKLSSLKTNATIITDGINDQFKNYKLLFCCCNYED